MNIEKRDFEAVRDGITSDEPNTELKRLLCESLFYYCAGIDPTPIAALYEEYPLFIYSDNLRSQRAALSEVFEKLMARLEKRGFKSLASERVEISKGGILTLLEKGDARFLILYVEGDSWETYSKIYKQDEKLIPRCISNIRYEMNTRNFTPIERRVRYVLGYSYSGSHEHVRSFEYLGDYNEKEVKLFELL